MDRKSSRAQAVPRPSVPNPLLVFAIPGLPEVRRGDDLAKLITRAARHGQIELQDSDVIVVAQKIVSKAEGQIVRLSQVKATVRARDLAAALQKDPRLVELILRQSRRVLRSERVLIVETHHGFVCANAGIDHSNVLGADRVALLPKDPDASARRLARELRKRTGKSFGVIISDTFGRPWRLGLTNVAIGVSGVPALLDLRGQRDRNRKPLQATVLAIADELASAAGLLMQKSAGTPVVLIRGYCYRPAAGASARTIIRPANEDLFR